MASVKNPTTRIKSEFMATLQGYIANIDADDSEGYETNDPEKTSKDDQPGLSEITKMTKVCCYCLSYEVQLCLDKTIPIHHKCERRHT